MAYGVTEFTAEILAKNETQVLEEWLAAQIAGRGQRRDLVTEAELRTESAEFLRELTGALRVAHQEEPGTSPAWAGVRDVVSRTSRQRAQRGFNPTETATFVFSLKQPVFALLRTELEDNPAALAEQTWSISVLLDQLGLMTVEAFQRGREEIIQRQQAELLELSTPVVQVWDGVLALPMIGTLDSARTQVVMETLLQRIVETGAPIAIIDITGVPTVDTAVAQHLLKTVAATRLMGSDCIISGIRPQIAQTLVHLGVDLQTVVTKASLADALALAFQRTGVAVVRSAPGASGR